MLFRPKNILRLVILVSANGLQTIATFYRPQRSWGKVMFLHVSVILFGGGVGPIACWDTPPWYQAPPVTSHPLQHSACWEIWATSGRYTPYWNAILFIIFIITAHNRSWGKIMFSQASVCPRGGGVPVGGACVGGGACVAGGACRRDGHRSGRYA